MGAEARRFRLTREQRAQLNGWVDLHGHARARFFEAFEWGIDVYVDLVDDPGPAFADRIAALSRLDAAIKTLLGVWADPLVQRTLAKGPPWPEVIQRDPLVTWRKQIRWTRRDYQQVKRRGTRGYWPRRMLLTYLQGLLDAEHVDPEDQRYVMQFACELVGTTLPEPSKLKRLLDSP